MVVMYVMYFFFFLKLLLQLQPYELERQIQEMINIKYAMF